MVSPDGSDTGGYPWRQSPMSIGNGHRLREDAENDGLVVVGFNDEGGPGFNQAVCVIKVVH